jgi:hypothetical protein
MPGKQLSISRSKALIPVIELAMERWPASKSEAAALTSALMRWFYDQQGDSRRAVAERTDKRLEMMDHKLDILIERGSHDTDHG